MKKVTLFFVSLMLVIFMIACKSNEKITIITPSGSAQLSILHLQNETSSYDVTQVDGPSALQSAFGSKSHDVILAPTNLGAKLYNLNNTTYRLLASVVFGNYYLVTKNQNIKDFNDLNGNDVLLFGENSTSDYVCKYLFSKNQVHPIISYVNSVLLARNALIEDNNKVVLLAEPQVSLVKEKIDNLTIIDLQVLYEEATNNTSYPQASVFVKDNLPESKINKIKKDLADSIKRTNENASQAADIAVSLNLGFPKSVLLSAIPLSNLGYKTGSDAKIVIEEYFNILAEFDENVVGGKLPDDDFYI
ncbi:hypothetical protein LJC17_01730 [Acholeplasma sp. OttesenSCG-928-E16]|nr:hypothetical protein [Acholeplasma sp. OttesenSCG-928-E16]